MFARAVAAFGFLALSLTAVAAQDRPRAVIELFTSQGCSSCPPADRLMTELARDPGLIVLTMPVDYWDYLGWKDTLANPAFSARQRAYSWVRGDRQVFTPQSVINGSFQAIGSERAAIDNAIGSSVAQIGSPTLPVDVRITRGANGFAVTVAQDALRAGHVWIVPVANERHVKIGRGENASRAITYSNVALGLTRIGEWTGSRTELPVPASALTGDADGFVVLVQGGTDKKAGRIVGAARLSLATQ
jgi:hypothetical protein